MHERLGECRLRNVGAGGERDQCRSHRWVSVPSHEAQDDEQNSRSGTDSENPVPSLGFFLQQQCTERISSCHNEEPWKDDVDIDKGEIRRTDHDDSGLMQQPPDVMERSERLGFYTIEQIMKEYS